MKATWNDTIIAESDDTVVVEGNHYFPMDSIKKRIFSKNGFYFILRMERNGKLLFYNC